MLPRFRRSASVLCMVTNCVLDHIYATHHHRISHWNADILNPVALQVYELNRNVTFNPLIVLLDKNHDNKIINYFLCEFQ